MQSDPARTVTAAPPKPVIWSWMNRKRAGLEDFKLLIPKAALGALSAASAMIILARRINVYFRP